MSRAEWRYMETHHVCSHIERSQVVTRVLPTFPCMVGPSRVLNHHQGGLEGTSRTCSSKHTVLSACFLACLLWLHLWHTEIPGPGIASKPQLRRNTTATPYLNGICDLCHSSWQCRILHPLSEARDRTCILMDTVGFLTC